MFCHTDREVLLIRKKRGHGAGGINGPGGKLDPGEGARACAIRETYEETGIRVGHTHCEIELRFVDQKGAQWLGFAFSSCDFSGTLVETQEAVPFWCSLNAIPYEEMWPDDAIWLPLLSMGWLR